MPLRQILHAGWSVAGFSGSHRIAMPSAGLAADIERTCGEGGSIGLEAFQDAFL